MAKCGAGTWAGCVGLAVFALASAALGADAPLPAVVDFNRDIRPIFSDNCYACHGPDKNKRKADLRLDTQAGIFSKIETRTTVAPGKVGESELFRRITADDPKERMPDPKSNKRLSNREIALVKLWIEQGASWKGHWAYLPPVKPAVPGVEQAGFTRNPIDHFVLARLKDAGLAPAPEAERAVLIRRLSFDLTGLPPSPKDVEEFVNDKSADAYEKLVDRLLASPHFGERMAVWWLDLVRYADSIGYHSDNPMNVSPFRDYVIKSFNGNKPFDRFTTEQLAGDLLPNATTEQKVASGYNRLLQTTEEGGAQPKEYEIKYLTDRVRNVSTVWLGSTMGCSQCHDHKFDPFTSKDFYNFGAFFADIQEASTGRREAGMPVPTAEQESQLRQLDEAVAAAKEKLKAGNPSLADEQEQWEKKQLETAVEWKVLEPGELKTSDGSKLEKQPDGSILASGTIPAKETYTIAAKTDLKGITGFRLEALPDEKFPAHGPGAAPNGNFVLTHFKIQSAAGDAKPKPVALSRATADFSQDTYPVGSSIDRKGQGWAVMPKFGEAHTAVYETKEPLAGEGELSLTFTLEFHSPFAGHQIGKLRLSATTSSNPSGIQSMPPKVREILAVARDQRNDQQKNEIADYFRSVAPSLQPLRDEVAKLDKRKEALLNEVPKCLVSTSGNPRTVRFLHRGNWMDTTGDVMSPAVPAFLAPKELQEEASKRRLTRLDLAKWIVSRDNPLTARVYVNRLWQMYFGQGLSKVLDDLGSQGEWPTHPELLDWMAAEFQDSNWDMKHIARLLVTSGAYRQDSKPSELDKEKDPYNRLLARQGRWRLDAEFVRDDALAISGLLTDHLGGPSVKPYQPAGYWIQLNFPMREYVADKGENQYRRGLYTWWQRSFLHPSLEAFDAPSREEATCERNRSNIPQQALVLLNDPTYVEASRAFAARIIKEGGAGTPERITFAYEVALSRKPRADEVKVLGELLEKHEKEYAAEKADAQKLLSEGDAPAPKDADASELAAWTSVARVILNLHETITRS
jgi:mono/diheme cytochrome c family protein